METHFILLVLGFRYRVAYIVWIAFSLGAPLLNALLRLHKQVSKW